MTDATRIMMEAGERVLGFAYTELPAEQYPQGMRALGVLVICIFWLIKRRRFSCAPSIRICICPTNIHYCFDRCFTCMHTLIHFYHLMVAL